MNQRGFINNLFLIGIAVALVVGVVAGYGISRRGSPIVPPWPSPTAVACTQETKVCPDGSTVGRVGPSCEFASCPTAESPVAKPTATSKPTAKPTATPKKISPVISGISPSSGPIGTSITITGSGFTTIKNSVQFGTGIMYINDLGSTDGKTISFTLPDLFDSCNPEGTVCWGAAIQPLPGTYAVYVINANGKSNAATFTVTVPPSPSPLPLQVRVKITESGFSPANVTIRKGMTVIFENIGNASHWPASDPHPTHTNCPDFDKKQALTPGASYSFTFFFPQNCPYHDHLNPGLKGSIIVEE